MRKNKDEGTWNEVCRVTVVLVKSQYESQHSAPKYDDLKRDRASKTCGVFGRCIVVIFGSCTHKVIRFFGTLHRCEDGVVRIIGVEKKSDNVIE